MDDENELNIPKKPGKKQKMKNRNRSLPKPDAPDAAHRKFILVMTGLFIIAAALMLIFNQYMDFPMDGGM